MIGKGEVPSAGLVELQVSSCVFLLETRVSALLLSELLMQLLQLVPEGVSCQLELLSLAQDLAVGDIGFVLLLQSSGSLLEQANL